MKIVFFGNADFGLPTLNLLNKNHTIASVVTNIDKRAKRGKTLTQTPIKKWARENNVNCIEQDSLFESSFHKKLEKLNADIFIVIAYRLLPSEIFNIPRLSTMNLHASMLPKYRGAAPIQRALLNGDKETGVSTFIIDKKIDKGNLILQKKCKINEDDNYGKLYLKLSQEGAELVINSIKHLVNNKELSTQFGETSYAYKIKKNETLINWQENTDSIINKIRAFSPTPGAFTFLNSKRVRLLDASKDNHIEVSIKPGKILIKNKNILIGTGDGFIVANKLQIEGKKAVKSDNFINGYLKKIEIMEFQDK